MLLIFVLDCIVVLLLLLLLNVFEIHSVIIFVIPLLSNVYMLGNKVNNNLIYLHCIQKILLYVKLIS